MGDHLLKHPKTGTAWMEFSNKISLRENSINEDLEAVMICHFLQCFEECTEQGHLHFKTDCPEVPRNNFRSETKYRCSICTSYRHDEDGCLWGGDPQHVMYEEASQHSLDVAPCPWEKVTEPLDNGQYYCFDRTNMDSSDPLAVRIFPTEKELDEWLSQQ